MPVFNAAKFLAQAMESILNQTYSDFELLICDDASSDESFEVVNRYKDDRIRVYRNDINQGYLKTCNFLFGKASGDLITWQDADDVSHPNRLLKQVDFLKSNQTVALCGTGAWYFIKNWDSPIRTKDLKTNHQDILANFFLNNQFCGASVMVRSSILRKVGGYQEYFDRIGNEDYDLFFRIAQQYPVENLDDILYFIRLTPYSISRVVNDPLQLLSSEIVQFLADQRNRNDGLDSITGLDRKLLDEAVVDKLKPYLEDPSMIKRKEADKHAYNKMYKQAFSSSVQALQKNPLRPLNYKYVLACLISYLRSNIKSIE